jgi:hypothetical protein
LISEGAKSFFSNLQKAENPFNARRGKPFSSPGLQEHQLFFQKELFVNTRKQNRPVSFTEGVSPRRGSFFKIELGL